MKTPRLLALLSATAAFALGCDACETLVLTRGNLDRVADVVVVTPDATSLAFTANPEIEALRVVDLTAGKFVAAPNRYSPLSVKVGPETRALAVASGADGEKADRIFALDSTDDTVRIVDTVRFVVTASFATQRAPRDVAALVQGSTTYVAVAYADGVDVFPVDKDVAGPATAVDVGDATDLVAIAADPAGSAFVVVDAAADVAKVLTVTDGAVSVVNVDVGGPAGNVTVGVVDSGDGLGAVAAVLLTNPPAIAGIRLDGTPHLVGRAELPALPLQVYVPDSRKLGIGADVDATVCCGGLSTDAEEAGEETGAFASVWLANGLLVHVALAATLKDGEDLGRPLVRLIDDDLDPLGATVDLNTAAEVWQPPAGGENFRPSLSLTPVDNYGTPPVVPIVPEGSVITMTWEGALTRAQNLAGVSYNTGTRTLTTNRDLAARDVRVGDRATFTQLDPEDPALCASALVGTITAVSGASLTVAAGDDFDADTAAACLGRGTDTVRVTVAVADAFVVEQDGVYAGRLADKDGSADTKIVLPGAELSVNLSSAGAPFVGSVLAFTLDPHVTTMGMDLSTSISLLEASGVGTAAYVGAGIAGGAVIIPDAASDDDTAKIRARRMVLGSASIDGNSGLPLLMTCDEAETSLSLLETFR